MSDNGTQRTVVLGLGNPVLSDDGVGLAVAARIAGMLALRPLPGVTVAMGTRGGFELIDLLEGCDRAILVDCCTLDHAEPGRVREWRMRELSGVRRLVNTHEMSICDAFHLAESLRIPMPAEVEIFTVDGADVTTLSESMTGRVRAAVEPLAQRIVSALEHGAGL